MYLRVISPVSCGLKIVARFQGDPFVIALFSGSARPCFVSPFDQGGQGQGLLFFHGLASQQYAECGNLPE